MPSKDKIHVTLGRSSIDYDFVCTLYSKLIYNKIEERSVEIS